jgi:hypothetical protein
MVNVRSIRITEIVGSSICVSIVDGTRLHDAIVDAFQSGQAVSLSFEGVGRLTTAFLNAAVGQLYNEYNEDEIRTMLRAPKSASGIQLEILKKVVDNAKRFFAEKNRIDEIVTSHRGDE